MANDAINPVLRLYADTQNNEGYSSVNHISRALMYESEMLSPVVTHLYYSSAEFGRKSFPLSFLTEGMMNSKGIGTIEYKMPVIGRPKKSTSVAYSLYVDGTDKPGRGGLTFKIPFVERLFHKNQILHSSAHGIQVQVKGDPTSDGTNWLYTVKLAGQVDSNTYCPVSYLTSGTVWSRGIAKVSVEDSKGVEHRSYSPGMMQNQLSVVRDTYKIKGNVENKKMVIEISAGGEKKQYWCEWEMYLRNLDWKEKCENDLWYSLYNKTATGEIAFGDTDPDSGQPIPSGAGLLQQIPNEDTYSTLTANKIKQVVRDAFFNASDADQSEVTLFTGTGGMEEFDNAMKSATSGYSAIATGALNDKIVGGSQNGYDLVYGAYFRAYKHNDGHVVRVSKLPLMDKGAIAEASEKHPITGLPLESYNMYFVDMSTYEGEANVQYVYEKGTENIEFVVAGARVPKGYDPTVFRASDKDASSIQWMKSQGIHMKRPTNSFKLICEMS